MAAPWDDVITIEAILELYREGMRRYGGFPSPPKHGCLDGSVGNAYTAEVYTSDREGLEGLAFAGYLLFYLLRNHCFTDGNKRIAWSSAMRALLSLGVTIEAAEEEAVAFCEAIATGDVASGETVTSGWQSAWLVSLIRQAAFNSHLELRRQFFSLQL